MQLVVTFQNAFVNAEIHLLPISRNIRLSDWKLPADLHKEVHS